MISTKKLRGLLEARVNEAGDQARGRVRFLHELRATLGLMEEVRGTDGSVSYRNSVDEHGRPKLLPNRAKPDEFSLKGLAEAIGGEKFLDDVFNPIGGVDQMELLEAGPGIDATTFQNINTFNIGTAGLVEAAILEKFENPAFIGDALCAVKPTKMNGQKIIGTGGIGDKALSRKPGMPHARGGFGEQYVTTPELDEKALAVEIQQEAVFYDLTHEVLDRAGSVGDELAYRQECEKIDGFIGVTNTYTYNGTAYNTYQTATPWINKHANIFTDYVNYDTARLLFTRMTDPMTGKEILIVPDTIVCSPDYRMAHARNTNATYVEERTQSLARIVGGSNPLTSVMGTPAVIDSPIFRNRVCGATGLNLGTTDGPKHWWFGQPKKAFAWMEAWPIRVRQASANEYVMLDRGLIAAYFANYRGVFAVTNPRYVVQNAHA